MKRNILLLVLMMVIMPFVAVSQENMPVETEAPKPLFTYPQAPDTIKSFQDRANYVVIRFWNNFDLSKPIQDEAALERAFVDYINFFPHAHKTVVINSIKDLMNKAQSNKVNFALIAALAEKNIYSDQAVFLSDEAYMPFAEAMVRAKFLKKAQREYYANQLVKINQNVIGAQCPELEVVNLKGEKKMLSEMLSDKMTLLYFTDVDCIDCMISKVRLSTSVAVNNLIEQGELKVICIVKKKYSKALAEEVATWANNWEIVTSDKAHEVFDLRANPSVFMIDGQKTIINKNLTVDMLLN